MMNSETVYWQCGFSAGRARKNGDEGLASHQGDWFSRAKALEAPGDRKIAEAAYKRGYAEGGRC